MSEVPMPTPSPREKTRLCFFITKGNFGGAQRYVYDLATTLPPDQYEICVIAGAPGLLVEKLKLSGIRTIILPHLTRDVPMFSSRFSVLNPIAVIRSLATEVRVLRELLKILKYEKPDILHLNSSKAGGLGAFAGRLSGIRHIVFTAHGWAFNENRSTLEKVTLSFLHWLTLILSHRTIANSKTTLAQIAHFPFVAKKITVIYPGIREEQILSREEARTFLKKTFSLSTDTSPWIGTVAEIHPTKGHTVVIEALSRLVKKKLSFLYFMAGSDGGAKEAVEALIEKYTLVEKTFFLGHVSEIQKCYKAFDIFVLASFSESFGYVLLEAALSGVPIVASRAGAIPEVLGETHTGLFPAGDVAALATCLEKHLTHPADAEREALLLQKQVHDRFSLSRMVKETETFYRNAQ